MFWFDLDNTPHVSIFRYIFNELDKRNFKYFITARDFAQTKELLELYKIKHLLVGEHAGKSRIKKISNLLIRAHKLNQLIKNKHITLAISHGSRSQLITSKIKRIPSIVMMDYEFTEHFLFNYFSDFILVPKFIPDERLRNSGLNLKKVIKYNGFKEEIYLRFFIPETNFREKISINEDEILIILRPPSLVSNYHDVKSEELLVAVIRHLEKFNNIKTIVVNRTNTEKKFLINNISAIEKFIFLERPVDGLQLLYTSDMVISGGGTMNREAALLGVPTFSIFGGKRPYLDEYLEKIGRLNFINNSRELEKIEPKRIHKKDILMHSNNLVEELTDLFLEINKKRMSNASTIFRS